MNEANTLKTDKGVDFLKVRELKKPALTALLMSSVAVIIYCFTWNDSIRIGESYITLGLGLLAANFLIFLLVGLINKHRSIKVVSIVILIAFNIVATFSYVLYFLQDSLIFEPNNSVECFNTLKEQNSFKQISITARDGTQLQGWLKIDSDKPSAPLVIFFAGNGMSSSRTFDNFSNQGIFKNFSDYNVMMVDYRGYGYSKGTASDTTMFSDSLDIYDYAIKQSYTDKAHVVPVGYSIGTGVATYLASQRKTAGLVLVAPYYNGQSLYNGQMDIFHGPIELLIRYKFDTQSFAPNVSASPLIITSKTDEIINYTQCEKLAGRFKNVYKFVYIKGVNHNGYFGNKEMLSDMSEYLKKAEEGGAQ
jgi:uncharacterized protein